MPSNLNTGKVPEDIVTTPPPLDIKVDLSNLTWGDMRVLMDYDGQRITTDLYDFLDRVIVGGIKNMRFIGSLVPILNAIQQEIARLSNDEVASVEKDQGAAGSGTRARKRGN